MNQYNLLYPDNNKIYYGIDAKSVAIKVFKNISKDLDQSRICLENNNTKKKYHFVAFKKEKLLELDNLLEQNGGNLDDDAVFYTKLNELSGNINLSVNELVKILKTKYDPHNELIHHDKVFNMLDEGLKKIEQIDNSVRNINKGLGVAKDVVDPLKDTTHLTNPIIVDQDVDQDGNVDNQNNIKVNVEAEGSGKKKTIDIDSDDNNHQRQGCLIM